MTDITPEELEELKRLLADAEFETRNSRESIIPTFGSFEGAFAHALRNAAPALIRSAEELGRVKARLEAAEKVVEMVRSISDNFLTAWTGDLSRHEIIRKVEHLARNALATYDRTAK
jgi:hypothetical protein